MSLFACNDFSSAPSWRLSGHSMSSTRSNPPSPHHPSLRTEAKSSFSSEPKDASESRRASFFSNFVNFGVSILSPSMYRSMSFSFPSVGCPMRPLVQQAGRGERRAGVAP